MMARVIGAIKDMRDVVEELARLELELVGAYEVALKWRRSAANVEALLALRDAHMERWKDLAIELRRTGQVPPLHGHTREMTSEAVRHAVRYESEADVLGALFTEELTPLRLYERWGRSAVVPVRLRYLFRSYLAESRRHRTWLQKLLAAESRRRRFEQASWAPRLTTRDAQLPSH
jgi:hypothetical protein